MRAVLPTKSSAPSSSSSVPDGPILGDLERPKPAVHEVLVQVKATALNRADLLQLRGLYPPPPGASAVPGLECSGVIESVGRGVTGWQPGDRVMALLAGGGQAEYVAVPQGQLMPIPESFDFVQAAALPEVAITAWTNLVTEGRLEAGQSVLITAAASGVGSFAVQLARELGLHVLVAGRSVERLERLRELGAETCLELAESLPDAVRQATGGEGVDVIMDLVGGPHLGRRLRALKSQGRLVLVGVLAGMQAELDLADVLKRRLQVVGSVLRARSVDEKAALVETFWDFAETRLADGRLRPVVHSVRPFEEIAEAYTEMQSGGVLGKLVLKL